MEISVRAPSPLAPCTASWKIIRSNSDGRRDTGDENSWLAKHFPFDGGLRPFREDLAIPRADEPIFTAIRVDGPGNSISSETPCLFITASKIGFARGKNLNDSHETSV